MVKRDFIRNIILVLLAILTFFLLRIFVFSTFKVHEDAANSYLANGDVVVVNKNQAPKYKDFIVYEVDDIFYISRVIATEGETATAMDDILYINDVYQEEPYIEEMKTELGLSSGNQTAFMSDFSMATITNEKYTKVPKNTYLVLNDDRRNTNDSRRFGLIKESQIRGVITFKIYPLNKFGFITVE